jgi:NADPH:quinone reductase-like Zn-dependent oxidoreductase
LRDVSIPEPGPGEVLVHVAAVSLNYRDKLVIESGRSLTIAFPFTPASNMAETIVALGSEVTRSVSTSLRQVA